MSSFRQLSIVVLLSVGAYSVWIFFSGYDAVIAGVKSIGLRGFTILLLLSLLNYFLRFMRWRWMLKRATGVIIPMHAHWQCYIASFALTATPGKLGEAVRAFYLKPYGIKVTDSLAALFAERLIDLMSVLIIGALALIKFHDYQWIGFLLLACVFTAALGVKSSYLIRKLRKSQQFIQHPKIGNWFSHFVETLESAATHMSWQVWCVGLVVGVVAWGAEAFGLVLIVKWLSNVDWIILAAGIYALSMIVGAVSFLPGGLGGAEAVMAGLLITLGISLADATTATIICRAMTLWLAVLLGLLMLFKLQLHKPVPTIPITSDE